jgi:inner membrane protein
VRNNVLVKSLVAALLVAALLIPLSMIRSLVDERQRRRESAIAEVTDKWGGAQTLVGPMLTVPYKLTRTDDKGVPKTVLQSLQLLPERLRVEGTLSPTVRHRGIFEVVLYTLEVSVSGTFPPIDTHALGIAAEDVVWSDAVLSTGITDTRGIRSRLELKWDGAGVPFQPSPGSNPVFGAGVHAPLPALAPGAAHAFAYTLGLQGSQSLSVAPLGVETDVALKSTWPHPSFAGAFLPESHSVTPSGFAAAWRVSHFGRSYPQEWKLTTDGTDVAERISRSTFGVSLFLPADNYQQSTRALKYAVLFIVLTFGAFFLFEVFAKLQLHPLQYLLVGLALSLFYLLLLAVSEHVRFGIAYAAAALAIVLTVAGYCAAILGGARRGLGIGALLAVLYGYLYVLLRAEDYALLMGAAALFVILAAVMYLTRHVDWWAAAQKPPAPPRPSAPPKPPVMPAAPPIPVTR